MHEIFQREEKWEYPFEALREALINAVCRRDYSLSSSTDVKIYDDKLEIINPGGLPPGITIDDLYKTHPSIPRNKGIAGIFYDLGLIEQWGSGILKMSEACEASGLPKPEFKENHFFKVIFNKHPFSFERLTSLGLNERQIKAIQHILVNGRITNREYPQRAGLSDAGALRDLKYLQEINLIMRKGHGRAISYILSSVYNSMD
ncbi:MAG: ATP-binding protein [Vulcanimicrobiota bacterium]